MSKNAEGWIRHRGGKCPVDAGALTEYRYRDGETLVGCNPEIARWMHNGSTADIMAYRVCEPAVEARPVESLSLSSECQTVGRSVRVDPLQWRDRIAEIDVEVQALTTERAELVKKLASEGFALIGRINDLLTEAAQKHEDMSDWRNWKAGDLIEMVNQKHWADMTDGKTYALTKAGSHGFSFVDDVGDEREAFERTANHYAKDLKWHSRPSA